jgi:plasmid replication initiation protein
VKHDKPDPQMLQKHKTLTSQGKDEMNLAEFPIARLGRKDSCEAIEYTGWVVDKKGQRHQQTWVVRSAAGLGLPTEFAERVLVALMALTAQDKFASRKVPFTVYRILKMVGLTHNKRNYKAVEKALKQLVGVTIYSEGAFWDKEKNKRVTTLKGFHIIEDIWLKYLEDDEDVIEEEGVNGYIVWGDKIWDSFKAGYIKNLDIAYYYSLENAVARRLYRFLDKRMHYQDEYQIDIFDLASRLGMVRYQYPSEVKKNYSRPLMN